MATAPPQQLLRDPATPPADSVLAEALGEKIFSVYNELMDILHRLDLNHEWKFYNDGKAWLCKVTGKKKTICWLSVWEQCIKVSFYFTAATAPGIFELNISNKVMEDFRSHKAAGKLLPLVLTISRKTQLKDLKAIAEYKKAQQ